MMRWSWVGSTADPLWVASKGTRRRWGSGRTETAVDESRKETADRVARYQTDYLGRICLSMLLVPQTTAAASKVILLSFGFPVLSFRSWSYSIDVIVLVLFHFVCHISGGARYLFFTILFCIMSLFCCYFYFFAPLVFFSVNASGLLAFQCTCRIQYDGMSLHCLLCLLNYNVVSLCRRFVTTELASL